MKFKLCEGLRDFKSFFKAKENRKTIVLIGILTLLILIVQIVLNQNSGKTYIVDKNGNIIGISRMDVSKSDTYEFNLHASNGNFKKTEDISLYLSGIQRNHKEADNNENNKDFEEQISYMVSDLENIKEEVVMLPLKLDDGTQLAWEKKGEAIDFSIILFFPLLVFFLYHSKQSKVKNEIKNKKMGIRQALPSFNNQLLLLLNSGLIFNDAFERIIDGYKRRNECRNGYLEKILLDVFQKSKVTNSSLILSLDEEAKNCGIKEFTRITSIISDNQYKGVNLTEKLENESENLWITRKKTAEEKGKIAETKLTFPLAILLLVLIIITAAPAILEI